jgi:histidine triad (HIT) family protein
VTCVFCRIVAGSEPSHQVFADAASVAFLDINPATVGHALVVPRRHAEDLYGIDPDDLAACARTAQHIATRARDLLGADGVNLVNACGRAAWQEVFHFHLHVVPRYAGDDLVRPWAGRPARPAELADVAARLRG